MHEMTACMFDGYPPVLLPDSTNALRGENAADGMSTTIERPSSCYCAARAHGKCEMSLQRLHDKLQRFSDYGLT